MTKANLVALFSIIVPLLILCTFLTYYKRFPTGDDAWFAEESYWLLHDGVIRSEFFRGLLGWDKQLFVSHKLFLYVGSLMMWLGGNSLYTLKSTSLIFLGLLIILFQKYSTYRKLANASTLLILFLLFSNTLIIKMSFEYRPEVMMMTLGFASYLLLQYQQKYVIALAGIIAGMSLLCHLNGVIYLIAGFFMLLFTPKKTNALIFGFFAIITGMFYFYDVWQANSFDTWLYQFRNDPATQNSFGVLDKLKVMLFFPSIFFKSPQEMAISIVLAAFFWTFKKRLNLLPRNLIVYAIALVVSFWLITKRATGLYEMLFIPTMMTFIIEFFDYPEDTTTNKLPKVLLTSFFLYGIIGVVGIVQLLYKINTKPYLPEKYHVISKYIPSKATGLVPIQFYFNEYEKSSHLLCFDNVDFQLTQAKLKPTTALLTRWAIAHNVDFMVFDYQNNHANFFPKPNEKLAGYKITYLDKDMAIYVKK